MMLAPSSASCIPQDGPARTWLKSNTVIPSNALDINLSLKNNSLTGSLIYKI